MGLPLKVDEKIAREMIYKLLSICFDVPKENWKETELIAELAEMLTLVESDAYHEAQRLMDFLNDEADIEELQVAYARLFVGPQKLKVPPYGSVYLERKRRVMGDSTMDLLAFYNQIGIKVSENTKEIPDHIKIELEVMYYLLFNEILALRKGDKDTAEKYKAWQKEFFKDYMLPWFKTFAQELENNKEHYFYTSLGKILKVFIAEEAKSLGYTG